jgi:hypothetical protein
MPESSKIFGQQTDLGGLAGPVNTFKRYQESPFAHFRISKILKTLYPAARARQVGVN